MNPNKQANRQYDDILYLPHHVSTTHPHMPVSERAAQFSPFAALTGHQEALRETARLTDAKRELDEHAKNILDQKLQLLLEMSADTPSVTLTYYKEDSKKSGGSYHTVSGLLRKLDLSRRTLLLQDQLPIPIDDIFDIDSELFRSWETL